MPVSTWLPLVKVSLDSWGLSYWAALQVELLVRTTGSGALGGLGGALLGGLLQGRTNTGGMGLPGGMGGVLGR